MLPPCAGSSPPSARKASHPPACSARTALSAPLCVQGVNSIGLLGSTGSYPYLSRAERRRALEAATEEAAGRVPILAGVGALRTDEAVRLAQDAKAIRADAD